ncbi:unnamed protein product [Caenorhabditis bovis]|uniref:Sphingomyelin synthase-like domain-containing protein n=1 Tax=Caenorhabditis bovis TaxID=2654633 RepID=A0A8S1ES01_9PELO|nr:unnamed protein product [Caenorhabditis bovis]
MKTSPENESLLRRYEHDEASMRFFAKDSTEIRMPSESDIDFQQSFPKPRKWPTFVALCFLFLGWFLNEIALAWIHERVPRDTAPLPDVFFSFFPEVEGAIRITEYIMLILIVNAFVIMLTHQHRWIVIRRAFFCIGMSYTFRALCVTVLQVPVPSVNTYCAPKQNSSAELVAARVFKMFWSAGVEQLRPRELCGDLIVSGHTLTIFTAFLVFKTYAPKKLQPLSHLYHALAYIALIAILLSRKHYFIDVILGYTVSTRMFIEYHSLALAYHENLYESSMLNWFWWSKLVPFFERDAPNFVDLHNHLSLPTNVLSSKKSARRID